MERVVRKLGVLALLLGLLVSVSGVPMAGVWAQPNKPLRTVMEWDVVWGPPIGWVGTVSGDIEGTITVTLVDARWTPKTEHFLETWVIETNTGEIWGEEEGVAAPNGRGLANGRITYATGDWTDLEGCRYHWSGTGEVTPNPPGPPDIHLELTMFILPSTGSI